MFGESSRKASLMQLKFPYQLEKDTPGELSQILKYAQLCVILVGVIEPTNHYKLVTHY